MENTKNNKNNSYNMGTLFNQIINANNLGKKINNIIDKDYLYSIEKKVESLTENIESKKRLYKRKRSQLNIYTHPFLISKYFILYIFDVMKSFVSFILRNIEKIIIVLGVTALSIYLVNENADPEAISTIRKTLFWYLYWIMLGVLSSIGFGTGLHTFVLFLGPHIAEVTTAAYTCGNLDFKVFGEGSFTCNPNSPSTSLSILSIFNKIKMQSFFWGLGTAIGELPPYFVSKAAALAGEKNQSISEFENEEKANQSIASKVKSILFKLLKKFGFIGILLCASIPNPLFDLAGILCGHFMIPFATFFGATFIGKAIVKNSIQSIFIIIVFSEAVIKYLLSLLSRYPTLHKLAKDALDEQTNKFKNSSSESVEEDSGIISLIWNSFIFIMIGYFIASIIESLAISQFNKVRDDEINTMIEESKNTLDIHGPDEKVIRELTSAVYKYISSYFNKTGEELKKKQNNNNNNTTTTTNTINTTKEEKKGEEEEDNEKDDDDNDEENNNNKKKNINTNLTTTTKRTPLNKENTTTSPSSTSSSTTTKYLKKNSVVLGKECSQELHSKENSDIDASYFIISKLQ